MAHQSARRPQRFLFVAGWFGAWCITLIGTHDYLADNGHPSGPFNVLALSIGMFFGRGWTQIESNMPTTFVIAQFAAPGVVAVSAFKVFRVRVTRAFRNRRAAHRRDHIVLIGYGKSGQRIGAQLAARNEPCVVVIEREGVDITPGSDLDRPKWAVVTGDATDLEVLMKAGVQNAKTAHVATGQDGIDLAVADSLVLIAMQRDDAAHRRPLQANVQIDSAALARRLASRKAGAAITAPIEFEFVDLSGLRAAAVSHFIISELSDRRGALPDLPLANRLQLIGGTSLVSELALLAERSHRARALLGMPALSLTPPEHFIDAPPREASHDDHADNTGAQFSRLMVVNLADPEATVELASRLAAGHPTDAVVALAPTGPRHVRVDEERAVGRMLVVDPEYLLQVPDVLEHGSRDLMARLIHLDYLQTVPEAQRAAGGPAMRPWDDLPELYRNSNRQQAAAFATQLATIGCELLAGDGVHATFTDDEVELLARREHDRWMSERRDAGWRYGPTRDESQKTHPDIRPYEELDEATKDKDRRVAPRLAALAALLGMTVVRGDQPAGTRQSA